MVVTKLTFFIIHPVKLIEVGPDSRCPALGCQQSKSCWRRKRWWRRGVGRRGSSRWWRFFIIPHNWSSCRGQGCLVQGCSSIGFSLLCRAAMTAALVSQSWRTWQRWVLFGEQEVSSSLTLVLPALVETNRVACPPFFSILLKISNRLVSSSPIFLSHRIWSKNMEEVERGALFSFWFNSIFNKWGYSTNPEYWNKDVSQCLIGREKKSIILFLTWIELAIWFGQIRLIVSLKRTWCVLPPKYAFTSKCRFSIDSIAVSLFGNMTVWTRRNTHNHQRVSEQKIQITILILKRGPCLEIARESQSELGWARVTVTEWARDRARVSQWEQEWASESLAHKHLAQSWSCTTMRERLAHKAQNWGGDWLTKHKIEREIGWQNRLKQICSLTQSYYCWLA